MFSSPWLHQWLGLPRSRKDRRHRASRQRRGVRPMLETLEDRITPSTVIENAPDAAMLQTDLTGATAANTQYIINLTGASSAYNLTAGQQLTVSAAASGSSVNIVGTGQSIAGKGNRVFFIDKGANVTVQNVTITGGAVTATSNGNAQGGGIFDSGGNVTLSKVTIQGNTASGGIHAAGGGIFVTNGNLTIEGGSVIQSNRAVGGAGFPPGYPYIGGSATGGGVYVSGTSTLTIRDSALRNNIAQGGNGPNGTGTTETGSGKMIAGQNGGFGGGAAGGGLYVGDGFSGGWTAMLIGDTFSGNAAIAGNGGSGAAGKEGERGGIGGDGGGATGGAASFNLSSPVHDPLPGGNTPPYPSGQLTILNDLAAPLADPSLFVDNTVQGGNGGNGGAGGPSTGAANNTDGERGGQAGGAAGGAVTLVTGGVANFTANIGNSSFFGNTVFGGNGEVGGAAGTGGTGAAGTSGDNGAGGSVNGGGLSLSSINTTLINCTVAHNTIIAGVDGGAATRGSALGGGIYSDNSLDDHTLDNTTLDNNTIAQNILNGGTSSAGSGIALGSNATLVNNLIQGNQSAGVPVTDLDTDLDTGNITLSNATNNFIGSVNANAVSPTTNIIGNTLAQLGGVVGASANGQFSGGPIYYPLLTGAVSAGYGSTSVLNTIASVEGTSADKATDEIGNLLSASNSLDIGAVQVQTSSNSSVPVITLQPIGQSTSAGAISFTVSAIGSPAPTVQWRVSKDGKTWSNLSDGDNVSGAATDTLTLTNVAASMNGYEYQAVFTNSAGYTPTGIATLTVNATVSPPSPPPALNVPPLLSFLDSLLGGVETVNANGTETITDSFFGIRLFVSTFDASGNLMSVDLFGFNITFLFLKI